MTSACLTAAGAGRKEKVEAVRLHFTGVPDVEVTSVHSRLAAKASPPAGPTRPTLPLSPYRATPPAQGHAPSTGPRPHDHCMPAGFPGNPLLRPWHSLLWASPRWTLHGSRPESQRPG